MKTEHNFCIRSPQAFVTGSLTRVEMTDAGKPYTKIFGKLKEHAYGLSVMQSIAFDTKLWSEDEVREHCADWSGNITVASTPVDNVAGRYPNVVSAVFGSPWAIMPEKLQAMIDILNVRVSGLEIPAEQIEAATKRATKFRNVPGGIAIIQVFGIIEQRMNILSAYSGGTSTELLSKALDRAMADDSIGTIILEIDSPGGSVYGTQEVAEKIYNARGQGKPIIASVNSLAASGAFWIASAADEIVITPSGEIGSVGVVAVHSDISKAEEMLGIKTTLIHAGRFKVEGNPHEPLMDEARSAVQSRIDEYYDAFVTALARGRGVKASVVKKEFGEGRVFGAAEAVARGMADRIGTLEQIISDLKPKGKANNRNALALAQRR